MTTASGSKWVATASRFRMSTELAGLRTNRLHKPNRRGRLSRSRVRSRYVGHPPARREPLGEAAHRTAVGAAHECARQRRAKTLEPRRLEPHELKGDPRSTVGQILEQIRAASAALSPGVDSLLDDPARLGFDDLELGPILRGGGTRLRTRLRADATLWAGEPPVDKHAIHEQLMVGEY